MSLDVDAPQNHRLRVGSTRTISVDFTDHLDDGETLTGSVTLFELDGTSDLTFAGEAVSTGTLTINDRSVAAGLAVTFRVSGHQAGVQYRVRITVSTTASQTPVQIIGLRGKSAS